MYPSWYMDLTAWVTCLATCLVCLSQVHCMCLYLKDALNLFQCIPVYLVLRQWILFDDYVFPFPKGYLLVLAQIVHGFNLVASILRAYI